MTLTSFVWPDQVHRLRLLRSALQLAGELDVTVDELEAGGWAEKQLERGRPGTATVIFHSIVMQYLLPADRERVASAIGAAGARATRAAPVAWLRMEPEGEVAGLRLDLWPGGGAHERRTLLATAGFHGHATRWLGGIPGIT